MTTAKVLRLEKVGNRSYHEMLQISNSQVSDYAEHPALYHGRHVTRRIPRKEPTPSMVWGSQLHELVEFGGKFGDQFAMYDAPKVDKRTKSYKAWVEANPGKDPVTQTELEGLMIAYENLASHPAASKLLFGEGVEKEVTLVGQCSVSGLAVRCRLDFVKPGAFIADLKTTRDVRAKQFANAVFDHGYHRQQVFYSRLAESWLKEQLPFFFVTVRNSEPYTVEVYSLVEQWVVWGEGELDTLMRRIRESYETDNWNLPHYGDVLSLPVPRYLNYQSEWEPEEQ